MEPIFGGFKIITLYKNNNINSSVKTFNRSCVLFEIHMIFHSFFRILGIALHINEVKCIITIHITINIHKKVSVFFMLNYC